MRKLIFTLMFLSCLFARNALAATCSLPNGTPLIKDITLPAETTIKVAAIGKEIARHRITNLWSGTVSCSGEAPASIEVDTALTLSALPKVYDTGIKGVGVKFCMALDSTDNSWCAPYSWKPSSALGVYLPRFVDVVFVRTGRGVGSGKAPMKFDIIWAMGDVSVKVTSEGSTELVNDVFFAGCESVGAAVNVQMGKQTIENIKKSSVPEIPFNFDVRCDGLKPDTKVPVKVYFEGNSQADGMLKLSNLGLPGVASGVGISLINDKGVKLPFDIERSVALDWNRDVTDGSVYRFTGSAKYAPTGGEIKPGKGDATMSFVLNYN